MSNNKSQKNKKPQIVNKMSYRELARNYELLTQSFNRVAMMSKILAAVVIESDPENKFLHDHGGVMTVPQKDLAQKFIDTGEFKRISELVASNIEENNAKQTPPEKSGGDA